MKNDYLKLAYFNGRVVDFKDAQVSVATAGLQYGIGCFGGIRGYHQPDGRLAIFRLDEHVARLLASAKLLHFNLKIGPEELKNLIIDLARRNQPESDIYIRPVVFKSDLNLAPSLSGDYSLAIYMLRIGNYLSTTRGLDVCVSSWQRNLDNAIPARAKATGAYINSVLAIDEASINGYDNAIMLDHHGNVTEGTVMNFFMVRGGQLVTPPRSTALLEGITRASILELAKAEGLEVVERQIARTELYLAEEAFFCGTAVQVAWIKQIDKRPISATIGPVTKGLQMKFNKIVRGQEPDYHEWLTVIQ